MKKYLLSLMITCLAFCGRTELTVFAAASTTDVMVELAEKFKNASGESVRFSFASSGVLARQIQGGAPADLFLSANQKWMDALVDGGFIDGSTQVDLLRNRLVLIVPKGKLPSECQMSNTERGTAGGASRFLRRYALAPGFRLAVGDIRSVPAGMYAAEALKQSGLLDVLRPKMVMASSVRGALMFVERGEVDAGIVYATDAKASKHVSLVSVFTTESHSPIRYPVAVCRASNAPALAREFLTFLQSGDAGAVFENYGFKTEQGRVAHESHE
jgi:molybdate transport system substrate-binding protein